MPDGSRVSIEDFIKQFPGNPVHVLRWVKKIFNQRSRPEVRPRDDIPVLTAEGDAQMNWWFVPEHVRDPGTFRKQYTTFNARIEGVANSRMYRGAWNGARRVAIPMSGYFEWREVPGQRKKQRYAIRDPSAVWLFAAGLYETHVEGESTQQTCTMMTQPAAECIAHIHDRMPVFVPLELVDEWLSVSVDRAMELLQACAAPGLQAEEYKAA
jgi:putative SOS response-associated peptidase YedK